MTDAGRQLPGVVLAGGRSSRMGTDKSVLVVDGMRMVDRALDALRGAGVGPLFVSGHEQAGFESDVAVVPDIGPDGGPLTGIVSTWAHLRTGPDPAPGLAVLSCDLPQIRSSLVAELVQRAAADVDAVLAHDGERLQPLVAVYSGRALDEMTQAWHDGQRSVRRLFGRWTLVEVRTTSQAVDADAPADLAAHDVDWPAGHEVGSLE